MKVKEDELKKRAKELDERESGLNSLSSQLEMMRIQLKEQEMLLDARANKGVGSSGNENATPNKVYYDVTMHMSPLVDRRYKSPKQGNTSRMSISPMVAEKKSSRLFQLRHELDSVRLH